MPSNATACLTRQIQLDSPQHLFRFAKAFYRKALALEGLQQTDAALEAITQAQQLEPKNNQVSTCMHDTLFCTQHQYSQKGLEAVNLQIQQAADRVHKTASLPASTASSTNNRAHTLTTEAPEEIHLRKRIKLQPGWLYHSSSDDIDENLLILLHGYGDTPGKSQYLSTGCPAEAARVTIPLPQALCALQDSF